jgi:hypothetical protein
MVPVVVLGLAVDVDLRSVVLLTPRDGEERQRTIVPIWVGSDEAALVSIAMNGEVSARPITHDLLQDVVIASGATLDRVEIPRIEDSVFHAELHLSTEFGPVVLDCRPSDAIALALRLESPLFVAEAILEQRGRVEESDESDESKEDEMVVASFRRFLDDVDPGDFTG